MAKRIVLLSDGTGNSAAKVWRTNVWRIFESLDLSIPDQVAFYDDGVGTSSFKPVAILGGAFGYGLKRNVLDIYKFVCRNYGLGDELYGFGFSRGAFTIRVVIGLILNQGLVQAQTESELDRKIRAAYRAYRKERFHTIARLENIFRAVRDLFLPKYDTGQNLPVHSIRFLGLWDTVAAYGLPVDEMTRGVSDWIWPLELPDHVLNPKIVRACHALSLDDERTTFHPVLWNERNEFSAHVDESGRRYTASERISQVWFAGMHANVGGGYPDDSMAYVPLLWIMNEARSCGLLFKAAPKADPDAFRHTSTARDDQGRMYDSRTGLASYYRYGPRKVSQLCNSPARLRGGGEVFISTPKIHESVFNRIAQNVRFYAPAGLPATYEIVTHEGEIVSPGGIGEPPRNAQLRATCQERVWDGIALRQLVYLLTVATTAYLLAYPLFHALPPSDEYSSRFRWISDIIRIIGKFLPSFTSTWTEAYARSPVRCVALIGAIALLIYVSTSLAAANADRMRALWVASLHGVPVAQRPSVLTRIRSAMPYVRLTDFLKWYFVPLLSALALIWIGLTLTSHGLFNVQDTAGFVCQQSGRGDGLAVDEIKKTRFDIASLCFDTGFNVEQGGTYDLLVTPEGPWSDGTISTSASGYYTVEAPKWHEKLLLFLGLPLRRELIRPWFRVVVRYGETGGEEVFLDPDRRDNSINNRLRPKVDGRLFLFVNDAVLGIPALYGVFYKNNVGFAQITLKRTRPTAPFYDPKHP